MVGIFSALRFESWARGVAPLRSSYVPSRFWNVPSRTFCVLLVFTLFMVTSSFAAPLRPHRGVSRCGTVASPEGKPTEVEARIALLEAFAPAVQAAISEVPVAFHIIQTSTGRNTATEAQIATQIARLNSAYSGVVRFKTILIDSVVNDAWFEVEVDSPADIEMRRALRVGDASTLNVYLHEPFADEPRDILGVSLLPWFAEEYPESDGVGLLYSTLPGGSARRNNRGKTLIHEVGHWLGLSHTFEPPREDRPLSSTNNGCRGKGDQVSDTPAEREAHYVCRATDSCPQPGRDPIRNFMNYTDDLCLRSFTAGQKARMRSMYRAYRSPGA